MADAIALFIAAVIVMTGVIAGVIMVRRERARQPSPEEIARRRRAALRSIDDYLRRLDQAASEEELDRLEDERDEGRDT